MVVQQALRPAEVDDTNRVTAINTPSLTIVSHTHTDRCLSRAAVNKTPGIATLCRNGTLVYTPATY